MKNTVTVVYWEQGDVEPGATALARACEYLGVTPNDVLLTGGLLGLADDLPPKEQAELIETMLRLIELYKLMGKRASIAHFKRLLKAMKG